LNGISPLLGQRVVVRDETTGETVVGTLRGFRMAASGSTGPPRFEWVALWTEDGVGQIELRGSLSITPEDEPNT
jgi:hypothetical protein